MSQENTGNSAYLLDCPVCGAIVDWCECGKCHQIHCKACGMIVDNVRVGNDAETLEGVREAMRDWWNGRIKP